LVTCALKAVAKGTLPESGSPEMEIPSAGAALTVTLALPAGEAQPAVVSVTLRPSVPAKPALKMIELVPLPAVMVPFMIAHAYVLPGWFATLAVSPLWPGVAVGGAEMLGVVGTGLTVMTTLPVPVAEPSTFETVVTV